MNISAWSIRNPVPALLLFAMLTLLGVMAFHRLGIQNFPDIEFPTVTVTASLEGAAPSQLETEVARKIENAVANVIGVQHIRTTVTEGSATINIEFALERNLSDAMDDVRDAVNRVRSDLPADLTDPVVSKVTTVGGALITFCVASDTRDTESLSWFVDDTVKRALLGVPGVGAVTRVGGVDREVLIELDPARLDAYGVPASSVASQLRLAHQETSGGRGDVGGAQESIRTLAAVGTAAELSAFQLPLADGRHIRLDAIATIHDTVAEPTAIALLDGKPVVGFSVTRSRGTGEVAVAQAVRAAVAKLATENPRLRFTEGYDTVAPIIESYHGSMHLLIEGGILAVVVVWWFLRSWRATLIAATALPLSILPTFLAMQALGFSLNTITLLSLALVVGVLVDDAIVEIENIERHLQMGKKPFDAAMEAADEIGLAVIATTFTLVAVFLPTAFMGGIPGRVFVQFGWSAGIAVLMSLLVARLLTPMMAAYLLKPVVHTPKEGWIMRHYLAFAGWCITNRWKTLTGAALIFAGSISLVPLLSTTFIPAGDQAQTAIGVELPPGSTLAQTRVVAEEARRRVLGVQEITSVFSNIGSASTGGGLASGSVSDVRKATLTVSLTPRDQRKRTQTMIESELRTLVKGIPGARVTVGRGASGEKLEVVLAGNDEKALATAAQAVQADLRTIKGLGNITSDASLLRPEVQVALDGARAAELGVTAASVMQAVRVATAGDFAASLPKLNLPDRQLALRTRFPEALRSDLDQLARLRVPAASGTVLLGTVAHLDLGSGPAQIDRLDRVRRVSLNVELNGKQLGDVVRAMNQLPALKNLPAGVTRAASGDAERMTELFTSFGGAMLIGILCIYVVLVLLFHDFLQPVTVLSAMPLAVGGALVALLLAGHSFSMPSIIGLLMLMGIVTKNSILLVDYAVLARRDHGLDRFAALVDACRKRARPIVMTTIAMAVGMLPIALGWSAEPSFRAPMATAVIGGLITSTLLSLLVVPAVFTVVDDVVCWLRRIVGGSRS
jgi:multidrug efflux pump subunit AcrB